MLVYWNYNIFTNEYLVNYFKSLPRPVLVVAVWENFKAQTVQILMLKNLLLNVLLGDRHERPLLIFLLVSLSLVTIRSIMIPASPLQKSSFKLLLNDEWNWLKFQKNVVVRNYNGCAIDIGKYVRLFMLTTRQSITSFNFYV